MSGSPTDLRRRRRQRSDAGAAEAQRRLGLIVDSIADGFYALDRDWRFSHVNDAALAYFGRTRDEMLGRSLFEVFPAVRGTVFETEYRRALETGQAVHFTASSVVTERIVEMHAYPGPGNMTVLFRDVTDQRLVQDALRDSEERLALALEVSQMGTWDLDLRRHTAWRSLRHDQIFGYESLLPEWTYETFLEHVLPEDRPDVDRRFREAVSTQHDWEFQCRIRRVDGAVRWIWARGHGQYGDDGEPVRMLGLVQDVTARKEAEIQLKESKERMQVLSEAMPQVVWSADATGAFDYYNQHAYEYGGVSPEDVQGWNWASVIHPEDLTATLERWRRSLETGETYVVEQRLRRADGQFRWHLTRGVALRDPDGRVVRWIGTATDIHDQKQAEARYRSLFDTTSDGVWINGLDGRIREVNDAYCRMSGYRQDEIVGMPVSDFEAVESPEDISEHIRKLIESGAHDSFESKHRRKDGSLFDVDITALYLEREGQTAIFVRDITARKEAEKVLQASVAERRRAEEALRDSRKKYQGLVETNVDFIWEMDAQGRYTYCSPQMETLWGLKPEGMIGRTPFDVMPEGERDTARRAFLELARSPGAFRGLESSAVDGRGRLIFVETSGLPIHDDAGTLLGFRGTTRDVTERRRAEEALREANARLTEADRRKDQFLATLSHELRNPLAPVKNSLYVLSHAAPGGDQARRARDVIERQVDQLSRLVDDLLDLTRITSGKIQLQRRRLELNELVRRTIEDHRTLFERSELNVEFEPAPREVFIHADWNRAAQVLGNLLHNAAKFTPAGGRVTISASADLAAGQGVVRVADTGAGIAPELLDHLFEPFVQADATLARSRGGLGLGLALAKELVELHGGSVEARSEGLGRGSEFTVRLPLDLTEAAPAGGGRPVASGPRRRVLVIEDGVDAADSLRDVLEIQGHEVAVAHDGPQGIATAREFHPEVVLCDIGLPGMDGYEVARAFRADGALCAARLVALSGYALPEDLRRAAEAGFERHLAKPPSVEELEGVLGG